MREIADPPEAVGPFNFVALHDMKRVRNTAVTRTWIKRLVSWESSCRVDNFGLIPLMTNTEKVATLMPYTEIIGVEDAVHWVSMEKPMQANETLKTFLAQ